MSLPKGFEIVPGFVRGHAAVLDELTRDLAFTQPSIRMFGREVKTPRLIAAQGNAPYSYSGITHTPAPWHPTIRGIRDLVVVELSAECGERVRFNTGLVNYYRDGADSIGWHADDEPELGLEPVIASVSLGAARVFRVRHNASREVWKVILQGGDLLVMRGRSQADYQHSLPKATRTGARINLTFRYVHAK